MSPHVVVSHIGYVEVDVTENTPPDSVPKWNNKKGIDPVFL